MSEPTHCPRCHEWRSGFETVKGKLRPKPESVALVEAAYMLCWCDACGVYWFEDRPEWVFKLKGG